MTVINPYQPGIMKYISRGKGENEKNIVCFHFRFHTTTPETSDSELHPSFRRSSVPVEGLGLHGWCSQPTEEEYHRHRGDCLPITHTSAALPSPHLCARWSTPSQSSSRVS